MIHKRRSQADRSRCSRARHKQATAVSALLAAAALSAIILSGCGGHGRTTAQISRPTASPARSVSAASSHGMNPKMVACERRSAVCNPAALKEFPLDRRVPAGTPLLTRQAVLSELGLTSSITTARRTTYRQIQAADPALAASSIIYPARIVWVVTRFFPKPVTVPQTYGPPSAPTSIKITAESFVIDAATGDITDSCEGCAALTRTGAIVRSR